MAEKIQYEDYIKGLNPFDESFVAPMHEFFTKKGYKIEIKPAANGPVVSYLTPKTKRTALNYVFRKSGMQVRVYGDNACKYQDFLQTIPDVMINSIDKAPACRICNARCSKGYCVTIKGKEYSKCRYGAFLFGLNPETAPYLKTFIENEITEREKAN